MESLKQINPKVNPSENANVFSKAFFWWTLGLFKKGYARTLVAEDISNQLTKDSSESLGDLLEKEWQNEFQRTKPSFLKALLRTFFWDLFLLGVLMLVNDVILKIGQTLILGKVLNYFRPESTMIKQEAAMFAGGLVFSVFLNGLMNKHYSVGNYHVGMRARIATCSLIYRKALKIRTSFVGGQLVNLMSNDVSRFDIVTYFIHSLWTTPLCIFLVSWMLFQEAGWPSLIGVTVIVGILPIQGLMAHLSGKFRRQTASRTDARVGVMNEIIGGIRVIKMFAWEKPYSTIVNLLRIREIRSIYRSSYLRGIHMMLLMFTNRFVLFVSLLTLVINGHSLTSERVFVLSSYYGIISNIVSQYFVRAMAETAETNVSIHRVQDFLLKEETIEKISLEENSEIQIENFTAYWDTNEAPTLSNISLNIKSGELIIVIGQVGCGKSSLLHALLGELPARSGLINIPGRISYAAQENWIFSATVRQNIIFGSPFDLEKYERVIQACSLKNDLESLPYGDLTQVGERGSSLSGGQKARINLARAAYKEADIYLLDDPLAAVDGSVSQAIFDQCITGLMDGKTRILATHQLQYINYADRIIILNNGKVAFIGSLNELEVGGNLFSGEDKKTKNNDDMENDDFDFDLDHYTDNTPKFRKIARQISQLSINNIPDNVKKRRSFVEPIIQDVPEEEKETSSKGTFQGSVFIEYWRSGSSLCLLVLTILLFVSTQSVASGVDYWLSYWIKHEETKEFFNTLNCSKDIKSNGVFFEQYTQMLLRVGPKVFNDSPSQFNFYMIIYSILVFLLLALATIRSLVYYKICTNCSTKLHDSALQQIVHTNMRFFDNNPSGRILNRFSKDFGSIDEALPKTMLDSSQYLLSILGSLIISMIVNIMYIIPIAIMSVLFWFVRRIYLKTSKDVKRLEGIAKSPVFIHLNATLQGLTTIRSYGCQEILKAEFDKHQDAHTACWFMFINTSVAFGLYLDILCVIYIALVTFSLVFMNEGSSGSEVGLAITQSLTLSEMLQWGIRQSAEVSNNLTSVERILEYTKLPKESDSGTENNKTITVGEKWPVQGLIEFDNVSLRYSPLDPAVLKNLTVSISPKEKVGIVGRTGAGKSSLISALFRLAPVEGRLCIDNIDISHIPLSRLRQSIAIIPQDPVLFSGTLRHNLDPFNNYPDHKLWSALEEVEVKETVNDLGGLDATILSEGANLSVGQRQLICLARAALKDVCILVLDEATANVDPKTDGLIQRTIRNRFAKCTVLTVAHRLHTVADSNKVIVMDSGRIAEFDHPFVLLQNEKGIYYNMVSKTGESAKKIIISKAKNSYNNLAEM